MIKFFIAYLHIDLNTFYQPVTVSLSLVFLFIVYLIVQNIFKMSLDKLH